MRMRRRATPSGALLLIACLLSVSHASFGQGLEEVIVTAQRSEGDGGLPGTFLRKTGDFLLLQVNVRNDTREAAARKDEIYATLRNALANANRDGTIELSVIDESELVIPLKVDSATVVLATRRQAGYEHHSHQREDAHPACGSEWPGADQQAQRFHRGYQGGRAYEARGRRQRRHQHRRTASVSRGDRRALRSGREESHCRTRR